MSAPGPSHIPFNRRLGISQNPRSSGFCKHPLEADDPPAKRARTEKPAPNLLKPTSIVTVNVRKNEDDEYETFPVHSNYICHYSPFFKAAFQGGFEEADKQEMNLEDTNPLAFGIFVTWLYTQQICRDSEDVMKNDITWYSILIDLWILADTVLVPRLQNKILEEIDIHRTATKRIPRLLYHQIYNGTSAESPLRLYLIDYCVNSPRETAEVDSHPPQLLVDIINETRSRVRAQPGKCRRWQLQDENWHKYLVDEEAGQDFEQRHELLDNLESTQNGVDASALEMTILGG
ncbi:uncharacterized protein PAC_08370 [Phialocephala subalpina]|uniref:BTB domain-containing protein n=1 Tax=Phialocephala subalpina TaxID=576137 RepID=A0A1L7X0D1_9HELO|nr:uncharacterized protein PAC_08370 [Phialocephala subalpina]